MVSVSGLPKVHFLLTARAKLRFLAARSLKHRISIPGKTNVHQSGMAVDSNNGRSIVATQPTADERLQKILDKALYANGNPEAQKLRNFLNGTWLGEPLHVVLTDLPIGAWTAAWSSISWI